MTANAARITKSPARRCDIGARRRPSPGKGGVMAKQDSEPDAMSTALGGAAAAAAKPGGRSNIAPHLAYHDLRQWLAEAQRLGEVKDVKGLNWQSEIGMVSELAVHRDDAPCFVFAEVPGTIAGSRVLVNFFGGKRKNMTLGFPSELTKVELSEGFRVH